MRLIFAMQKINGHGHQTNEKFVFCPEWEWGNHLLFSHQITHYIGIILPPFHCDGTV